MLSRVRFSGFLANSGILDRNSGFSYGFRDFRLHQARAPIGLPCILRLIRRASGHRPYEENWLRDTGSDRAAEGSVTEFGEGATSRLAFQNRLAAMLPLRHHRVLSVLLCEDSSAVLADSDR